MNTNMKFAVTGQRIELTEPVMLVAGTVNIYTAAFVFNSAWEGYTKTAVFRGGDVEREQLLTDDACTVPWEVLAAGKHLRVGVYGTKDDIRLPTIWTERTQYINSGAGPTDEAAEPSPTLVEQLTAKVGNLDALKTEDKSSVVAAVNEIWKSGGGGTGGGTTDHSKLMNRDAAGQHPMSAITGLEQALEGKQPKGNYLTDKDLDTTLKEVGKAADAAAVGERLDSLSEEITNKAANVYIGPVQPTDGTLYWLDTSDSGGSGGETVTHTVTSVLTNVSIDNTAASVNDGASFAATLTPFDGYTLSSATVTMGGNDITASAYASGNIYIASVTGDIVITAVAVEVSEEVTTYTITNNLANATSNNSTVSVEENSQYTATLTPATDYRIETVTVTMGGVDVTSDVYADGVITIPAVTGDVVITVTTISAQVSAVFELEAPMTFDGAEEYQIDYCLTDKDKDWSAVIDFTAKATGASYVFRSGNTGNNSLGIRSQGSYFWLAQVQYYDSIEIGTGTVTNKKVVFTHVNGSNELNVYYVDRSGSKQAHTFTREYYVSDLCGTNSVTALGKHPCTIDEFKCYARVISESEINTFLGVE